MPDEAVLAAMRRAVEAGELAKQNPTAALYGKFPGHSSSGTASVWVDIIGRMVRLELAPGSVQEGDEEGIAAAIAEAYVEAVKAASIYATKGLGEWQRANGLAPAKPDDRRDDDNEERDFLEETF
jgi:hypothetical protein